MAAIQVKIRLVKAFLVSLALRLTFIPLSLLVIYSGGIAFIFNFFIRVISSLNYHAKIENFIDNTIEVILRKTFDKKF